MKNFKFIFGTLIIIGMLSTLSCNKDDGTPPDPNPNDTTTVKVVINEVMTKDTVGLVFTDGLGDGSDWAEIYNTSDKDLDIGGYFLSDKGADATTDDMWEIPTGNSAVTTVKSHTYLVIVFGAADANGNDLDGIVDGRIHCPSGLSSKKDVAVALFNATKVLVDASEEFSADGPFGKLEDGKSLGRESDGSETWKVFDIPTPGAENK